MDLDLQNRKLKGFKVRDLFKLESGVVASFSSMISGDRQLDCVGATSRNNGNVKFVDSRYKNYAVAGNCIVFIRTGEGSVGDAVYKGNIFIPSKNVSVGRSEKLNRYTANFFVNIINNQAHKYNYGYVRSDDRLENEILLLPLDSQGDPDYAFMEAYMRQMEQEKLDKYKEFIGKRLSELQGYKEVGSLEDREWKEFEISDLFEIISGKDISEKERTGGEIPFISATSFNNGIGDFVGNKNETIEAGCISVNRTGSVGYSFYHPYQALYSNNCRKLRSKVEHSRYVIHFLNVQISSQKDKYSYGYILGTARLMNQKILLPIDSKGNADYEFMENFMKRLECEKLSRYLSSKY